MTVFLTHCNPFHLEAHTNCQVRQVPNATSQLVYLTQRVNGIPVSDSVFNVVGWLRLSADSMAALTYLAGLPLWTLIGFNCLLRNTLELVLIPLCRPYRLVPSEGAIGSEFARRPVNTN